MLKKYILYMSFSVIGLIVGTVLILFTVLIFAPIHFIVNAYDSVAASDMVVSFHENLESFGKKFKAIRDSYK